MVSTVTPSALKYPLSCATKNGACVPWMIQSIMILTFFVSALAATTGATAKTRDNRTSRPSMRIPNNVCALLSERIPIIDCLHRHQPLIMFDEKRQRIQAWHGRQRSLASVHAVDFASPFLCTLQPRSQQISCQPTRHYRIARRWKCTRSYASQQHQPRIVGTGDRRAVMNFVDLDRVSLRYGEDADGTLALHGATLQVSDGEFVAVVGPSGCGKSTLMKVVTGLWPPTAGAVIVSGRPVTGPLSIAGMAFQNPTLLP